MSTATPKQMVGNHRRSLKALEQKIRDMSDTWADVDECNRSNLEELANTVKEASERLAVDV